MKIQISLSTAKQQLTPAFRAWFKHSKVVDKNGNPRRCYHGTIHPVESFHIDSHGKNDFGYLGVGFYFTARAGIANSYGTKDLGGHILPVYLSLQNPYIIHQGNWQSNEHGYGRVVAISQAFQAAGMDFSSANRDAAKQYRRELEEQGYDGIIDDTDGEMTQIVAFYPSQIKSAVGNNGNFDPKHPHITH